MTAFIVPPQMPRESGRRTRSRDARIDGRPAYITLPPLAVHSCAVLASVKPWPLQAFCPLQALLAPLQALWPLQALAPPHLTLSAAKAAVAKVVAAKIEAAVAINVRLSMESSWSCEHGARIRPIRRVCCERYATTGSHFCGVAAAAGL